MKGEVMNQAFNVAMVVVLFEVFATTGRIVFHSRGILSRQVRQQRQ